MANAFELEAVDGSLRQERLECVGELDLAFRVDSRLFHVLEDRRRKNVAPDDREVGRRLVRGWLFHESAHPMETLAFGRRRDDSVARDLVPRNAHHREDRSIHLLVHLDHLLNTGDVRIHEIVAE